MDNPLQAVEHLPKQQKYLVIGGAVGLGGLLVYRSHQKNLAAAQAATDTSNSSSTDPTTGTSSGTAADGTSSQDPNIDPNTGVPYADEMGGMNPSYGTDPYDSGLYGGLGYDPGAFYGSSSGLGAGDLMGTTATAPAGTENLNIHVTGGGAPSTHHKKHLKPPEPGRNIHHRKTVHHAAPHPPKKHPPRRKPQPHHKKR